MITFIQHERQSTTIHLNYHSLREEKMTTCVREHKGTQNHNIKSKVPKNQKKKKRSTGQTCQNLKTIKNHNSR